MKSPDLSILLDRIGKSDPIAFQEVFDLFSPRVYGFARKLTQSPELAEEIVQDVFMKIWVSRDGLSSVNYFPSYLYTITRNHAFNMLKRLAVEERVKENFRREFAETENDSEVPMYQEYQHILIHAVNQLPPQQRLVYSLCHQKGLKYEEVARQLNISRLTVKTHMQKAIRTIKSHFRSTVTVFLFILMGS